REVLGRVSWGAIGAKAFDFNNDGKLDLLIVDMHSDMWLPYTDDPNEVGFDLRKKYPKSMGARYQFDQTAVDAEEQFRNAFKINYHEVVFGNTLFKQLPNGKFEEMSDKAGMETWWPWGIAT